MAISTTLLLQRGTILQHGEKDVISVLWNTDILICDDKIADIGQGLSVPPDARVIDCEGKIVSPGFIDTHHHVWQTQLRGRHSDDTLLDYTPKGNLQFFNYTPNDVFWGELGGLLESIEGGTTCVVDHAHMTKTPDHAFAGLAATHTSGIRSVFCYSLVPSISRWDEKYELDHDNPIPDWFLPQLEALCKSLAVKNGIVEIGLGFDSYHLPQDDVLRIFHKAREFGVKIITSHWRRNNIAGTIQSVPQLLHDLNLLKPDMIISHATGSTDEEFKLLKDTKVYISSTPATESQMAHGDIVAFRKDVLAALGIDCQSNNPASMLDTMRVGLAVVRAQRNAEMLSRGKFPSVIEPTTLQAFNLATIHGARAIGSEDKIGSLEVGKQADILLIDSNSPAMICASAHDPLVAVVRHATSREIDTVIVAGQILKEAGKLVERPVDHVHGWNEAEEVTRSFRGGTLGWDEIAKQLHRSRTDIQNRMDKCNLEAAKKTLIGFWGNKDGEAVLE